LQRELEQPQRCAAVFQHCGLFLIAPGRGTAKKGKGGTASPVGALAHARLSINQFVGRRRRSALYRFVRHGRRRRRVIHLSDSCFGALRQQQMWHSSVPIFWPQTTVLPNPSLNRTRYGSRRLAAPGHSTNCPCAASRRLPQRAG